MNAGTRILAQLDAAVVLGRPVQQTKMLNDALVKWLRDEKNPAPEWDEYPTGRSYFCQRHK